MVALAHISPTRIEALSDMIFGLALSITAIQLAFAPPNNQVEVVGYIAEFIVSFGLLVWIWMSYTRITERVTVEREKPLLLNASLLLLVSLEPYLLFIVWTGVFLGRNETILNLSSIAWSLDVAFMFVVLGLMTRQGVLYPEHEIPPAVAGEIRFLVVWRYISGVLLGLAALPPLWTWAFTTSQPNSASLPGLIVLHARYLYWIVAIAAAALGAAWIARWRPRGTEELALSSTPTTEEA